MYGMTHQKALKTGIIAAILLVTVILTAQQQHAQASNSIDNGYKQGESDAKAGMEKNNTCPPSYDHTACVLYEQSYNAGYGAEKSIHDNDRPRNDYTFDQNNDGSGSGTREDDGEFVDEDDN